MAKLRTDEEVLADFDEKFMDTDRAPESFINLEEVKSFILSLRKEDMRVVREVVEKLKPKYLFDENQNRHLENVTRYNVVDEVLSALSSLEREGE